MIICMLKENRLWDACTSCCSFPRSGSCPCVGQHMGPKQPWSSGRAGKLHVAHLPHHTPPPPSAEFTLPSTSWPVSVSICVLGFSRFGGELPVKMLLLDSSVGWGGSVHQQQPCLLPCLLAAGHLLGHKVPSSWHLTARPGHSQRATTPSSGAAQPLSSSGTVVCLSCDFLFPGWSLRPRLVSPLGRTVEVSIPPAECNMQ